MNKNKKFIPFLLLFSSMLLACGEPTSSISSKEDSTINTDDSTIDSSIETDTRSDYKAADSVEGLVEVLLMLKNEGNFTIRNNVDGAKFLFSSKFFINEDSNIVYANLPSHKDNEKMIAYKVARPRKGDPYVCSMGYYTDSFGERHELTFADLNCFSYLEDDLSSSSFVYKDNVYQSEDSGVITSFASFYGSSSISKVSFWFDEENTYLNFEVFDAANSSLATGSIYHISNTKDKDIEDLVDNFSWDNQGKALTKAQAGTLFDENFSCTTNITKEGSFASGDRIASIDFSCNANTIYIHSVDDPDGSKMDFYNYLTKRESDGRAIYHGLDAQNKQVEEETNYFFEQWPVPKNLDINDFRLCGDGNYRYFSLEPNLVYQTLAHVSINDQNCSFEEAILNLEDNKVTGVTMNSTSNLLYSYQAVATLKPYAEITMPTSYEDKGPREIKNAMSYFDGTSAFKVIKSNTENVEDASRRVTYVFDGTTYLIKEEYFDNSKQNWSSSITGYTLSNEGKVIPFRQIKGSNRLVQSDDIVEGDTITNHFPKLVDERTVKSLGDDIYAFRELVTNTQDSIWISGNVIPSTVKMKVSGGKLVSMLYGINYSSDEGEYVYFSYDDISLPEGIDVKNIGPMELTCYADDSYDEWCDLVTYIGEENALLIPYYYDKKNVGNWYAEPRYSSGTSVPDADENGVIDYEKSPLIGVGLYLFGSHASTNVLDQGFIDNGFTKLSSGMVDVGYRDDDYVANGYDSNVYLIDASKQTIFEKTLANGYKLRVVYDSDVAFFHFNPSVAPTYTLASGLLIQLFDAEGNIAINRNGEFH